MTGEIITIQVGQCGNHVGQQFWSQLADEHGIGKDGRTIASHDIKSYRDDHTNPFFKQNDENRYTPRAIMLDLEPKVINDAFNGFPGFFDPRNSWVSQERYGAGNSWAKGYIEGQKNQEIFLDMIDKELDSTESFEGFQMLHSVAGGTGSGLGSNLLEAIADRYPKKFLTTHSVFPSGESEVVVQPYNTILTLRRLVEDTDASIVYDNNALMNISERVFREINVDYQHTNQLITSTMSAITNSIRFPSYMYTSLQSIFSTIVPTPELHFLTPAFTPFTTDYVSDGKEYRQNTAYDVLLDLIDNKNSLVSYQVKKPIYFNTFNTVIGTIDRNDITRAISKIQQRLQFASWSPSVIHVNNGRRSPYLAEKNLKEYINGMGLSNTSGIVTLLQNACHTFDKIFSKGAFLNTFQEGGLFEDGNDEFIVSREVVQGLIEEYISAEEKSYLDEVLIEDENMVGNYEEPNADVDIDADGDNVM